MSATLLPAIVDSGINFRGSYGEPGACRDCGRKSPMKVSWVRPIRQEARVDRHGAIPAKRWSVIALRCLDQNECRSYCRAKRDKAALRSGTLIWAESRFKVLAKKGECHWCGQAIVLADPTDHRRSRREYHRGDEHEVGDRDCSRERDRSYAYNPRALIQFRGDPCCVDCGDTGNDWDADHDHPLWDGGEHSPVNLVRRCSPCHKAKTAGEARQRAERRRFGSAVASATPTQPELQEAVT